MSLLAIFGVLEIAEVHVLVLVILLVFSDGKEEVPRRLSVLVLWITMGSEIRINLGIERRSDIKLEENLSVLTL